MTEPAGSIFESRAFRLEAGRSEYARIRWTLWVLAAVAAVAVARNLVLREEGWQRGVVLAVGLGATFILYEALMAVLVRRYVRNREPVPEPLWRISTVVEALLPTGVIAFLAFVPAVGPLGALTMPAIGLYYVMILLATMRLRPALCLVSGGLCAAGYLGLVAWVFSGAGRPAEHANHWAIYATSGVLMALTGVIAAAVSSTIRRYLAAALHEAAERQRAQLHARNTLIFGLAKLAEYRDTDTGAHLERISEYSALLADALRARFPEIGAAWVETIRVASSMHDIGKVGIPDGVLLKPGKLTPDERKVIEQHPRLGSEALRAILERHGEDPLLRMSDEIAIGHHERWDGSGYPGNAAGDAIALAARIISVADVYDALTSARVYKPALSHAEACRIIREGRGTRFDPAVVDAFLEIGERFDELRRKHADKT
jgi:HD-GYP domain-containing protein (c-di-GMP phosphodiesterase class II)